MAHISVSPEDEKRKTVMPPASALRGRWRLVGSRTNPSTCCDEFLGSQSAVQRNARSYCTCRIDRRSAVLRWRAEGPPSGTVHSVQRAHCVPTASPPAVCHPSGRSGRRFCGWMFESLFARWHAPEIRAVVFGGIMEHGICMTAMVDASSNESRSGGETPMPRGCDGRVTRYRTQHLVLGAPPPDCFCISRSHSHADQSSTSDAHDSVKQAAVVSREQSADGAAGQTGGGTGPPEAIKG